MPGIYQLQLRFEKQGLAEASTARQTMNRYYTILSLSVQQPAFSIHTTPPSTRSDEVLSSPQTRQTAHHHKGLSMRRNIHVPSSSLCHTQSNTETQARLTQKSGAPVDRARSKTAVGSRSRYSLRWSVLLKDKETFESTCIRLPGQKARDRL